MKISVGTIGICHFAIQAFRIDGNDAFAVTANTRMLVIALVANGLKSKGYVPCPVRDQDAYYQQFDAIVMTLGTTSQVGAIRTAFLITPIPSFNVNVPMPAHGVGFADMNLK